MIKNFILFIFLSLFALFVWMAWSMTEFSSRQINLLPVEKVKIDENRVIKNLSDAITYETISDENSDGVDAITFLAFHKFLRRTYPKTFRNLKEEIFSGYTMLLKWEGKNTTSSNPILLMAHMDVVPAGDLEKWSEAPFLGTINNNFIHGRGAIDDKSSLISILESVEYLLESGFQPERDIYISFGHDEENSGVEGNAIVAESLKKRGVYFDYVLDEGSIITDGIISDISYPVAVIGVAEKGYLSLKLTSTHSSGHSSMPGKSTTIGKLSSAIHSLERNQMSAKLTSPVKDFLLHIGPEMSMENKFAISNMTLLSSSIIASLEEVPATDAMLRTTMAPTIISGGNKSNVLPSEASVIVNFRIRQGDSVKKVKEHVINTINDQSIKVEVLDDSVYSEPSNISSSSSSSFDIIHKTIKQIFNDVIVSPGLVVATTDSRYFQSISKDIYRFMPIKLSVSDISMIHGYNEKISIESYLDMIQFYIQLIKNSADS